jgi:hypothetical protein
MTRKRFAEVTKSNWPHRIALTIVAIIGFLVL